MRTPVYDICREPVRRDFLRAYLLFAGVAGPYDAQQLNQLHVPAAFGVIPEITDAREVYPDQAFLLRGSVEWVVLGLLAPIPVAGYRLRYEPPQEPAAWQNLGFVLFESPGELTPELNGLRGSFTLLGLQRPGA